MALALEKNLDLVVLDDKDARKAAGGFGLRVTGTLENIKPHIETLRKNGFRISDDIVERILKEAGEL